MSVGQGFAERYAAALRAYLDGGGEAALERAYELGRSAVTSGVGLLAVSAAHHAALEAVLLGIDGSAERARAVAGSGVFHTEAIAPFEMVQRGVEEANAELVRLNTALREESRRADDASRHKSEFLANMSHELRTPLNAILGFSDLILEHMGSEASERQRRYVRNITEAGAHLLGLINDVLDLSKVEAGRLELRTADVALDAAVEPVLSAMREAAGRKGITLDVACPPGAHARVDLSRFRQILYNLLSNAVKFTPEGGRVSLRIVPREADLEIDVADTGIGIPSDRQGRVFGTFERLHEGRSEATGTGLGLALTKRLVELHGGTIGFESAEGRGTTFRLRLPNVLLLPAPASG